jgi:metallo-beta-lactamase family protein
VLTASGMLTGGRVLHHLFQVAPDRRSAIVLAGYQSPGTRGDSLFRGAASLRVFGEDVPVRAEVVTMESLSAHADADELVGWLRSAPRPPAGVSVVHGEAGAADTLRRRIRHELGWSAAVPGPGDHVTVAGRGPTPGPAGS